MVIERNQIVTLADNKMYFVLETGELDGIHYLYLIEKDNMEHLGFYKEIEVDGKLSLASVYDEAELKKVHVMFLDKMKHHIETKNQV